MTPTPVRTVADAEAALGPELVARARALSMREHCRPSPEQLDRLRRIFTHQRHGGEHAA